MFPREVWEGEFSIDLEQHLSNYLPGMVRHVFYIVTQYMQKCMWVWEEVWAYLKIHSQVAVR